jgi:hypothetical protein
MRYHNGWIYSSPMGGVRVLQNDAILNCWKALGAENGELGPPAGDRITADDLIYQEFTGGVITASDTMSDAARLDGAAVPMSRYRLILERVICERESDGPGSDDVWLTIGVSAPPKLTNGVKTNFVRWRDRSLNSGDNALVALQLYAGLLPDAFLLTTLGVEVDASSPAQKVLDKFEADILDFDKDFALSADDWAMIIVISGAAGAVVGGIIGVTTGSEPIALTINGIPVGIYGGPWAQLGAGATSGMIVGVLVGVAIALIGEALMPDPFIANRTLYSAKMIRGEVAPGSPDPKAAAKIGVNHWVGYDRRPNGDLVEYHTFSSDLEHSRYVLKLRHHEVVRRTPDMRILRAEHSDKVVDVWHASGEELAPVIQFEETGGDNQWWRLEPLADGYVRIVAVHSGLVLDVKEASLDAGAAIIQFPWNGGDNQRWRIDPVGDANRIIAKHSGMVLDVSDGGTGNEFPLIQSRWTGAYSQRFRIE